MSVIFTSDKITILSRYNDTKITSMFYRLHNFNGNWLVFFLIKFVNNFTNAGVNSVPIYIVYPGFHKWLFIDYGRLYNVFIFCGEATLTHYDILIVFSLSASRTTDKGICESVTLYFNITINIVFAQTKPSSIQT